MGDNRPEEARLIVAHHVIYMALHPEYPTAPEWENYPEIGQDDWKKIELLIDDEISPYDVEPEVYEAAYGYLDARADAE